MPEASAGQIKDLAVCRGPVRSRETLVENVEAAVHMVAVVHGTSRPLPGTYLLQPMNLYIGQNLETCCAVQLLAALSRRRRVCLAWLACPVRRTDNLGTQRLAERLNHI